MAITGKLNSAKCMTLQTAHESFGHAAPERILRMAKSGKYNFILTHHKFQNCDACSASKLAAPSQPTEASRVVKRPGEVVNAEVIGPINDITPAAKYVSILIDRATNYASVESMPKSYQSKLRNSPRKLDATLKHYEATTVQNTRTAL